MGPQGRDQPIAIDGEKMLLHGQSGKVVGPHKTDGSRLSMEFDDKYSVHACYLETLSRSPPTVLPRDHKFGETLPCGYNVGEMLYYVGASQTLRGAEHEVLRAQLTESESSSSKRPERIGTKRCQLLESPKSL